MSVTPLTDEQREELRQALVALEAELREMLNLSADGARPVELDQPIGRLSRMDAMQQQSMTRANRLEAENRLKRVESALSRVEAGTYGACLSCREPVAFKRLQAQPDALLCINCQGAKDRR